MSEQMHNCEIIGEIGSGGMAVVYKAVQNSLNRPVAIKELKEEYASDPQIVARFVREAISLAALQHENIVQIHDFFQQGKSFRMLMEYVEGIDLFDLLDRVGQLPLDIALLIAHQVCSALEYAHYRGIIHRDIKPSNIIVSYKGEVKLMDFGIARDENLGDLTRPGTSLGTPAYMSPEQIMGVKIDFRSDLFSFGIVLYQMLTGTKPFVEGGAKSIMHKILSGDFVRPRRIQPNIPRKVEKIILRCMAKEPDDRYQSTGELKRELERLLMERVRMNYSGRIVTFLYHKGIIPRKDAENFVPAHVLEDRKLIREDENLPPALSLKTIMGVQSALAAILVLWMLIVQVLVNDYASGAEPAGAPGALKVVVWPWADIYIDGAYIDTSPVARSFSLPPGIHTVELKNPYFENVEEKIFIEPGRVMKRSYTLKRKKE
ncbi:MAG: serine/threonine protein kinase [Deltaproteobacteria bacterium]|nr:MAG: serine/threonine protein kinase [Deltaproteobacteria bacterium]